MWWLGMVLSTAAQPRSPLLILTLTLAISSLSFGATPADASNLTFTQDFAQKQKPHSFGYPHSENVRKPVLFFPSLTQHHLL